MLFFIKNINFIILIDQFVILIIIIIKLLKFVRRFLEFIFKNFLNGIQNIDKLVKIKHESRIKLFFLVSNIKKDEKKNQKKIENKMCYIIGPMGLNWFVSCVENWERSIWVDTFFDKKQRNIFEISQFKIHFYFRLSISTQTIVSQSECLL